MFVCVHIDSGLPPNKSCVKKLAKIVFRNGEWALNVELKELVVTSDVQGKFKTVMSATLGINSACLISHLLPNSCSRQLTCKGLFTRTVKVNVFLFSLENEFNAFLWCCSRITLKYTKKVKLPLKKTLTLMVRANKAWGLFTLNNYISHLKNFWHLRLFIITAFYFW